MPFVNIKITLEATPVTAEQKAQVIEGVTVTEIRKKK
jgi:phenylpyruvate tautomerase PptA (4-oxalocrotonate tautomerase family)